MSAFRSSQVVVGVDVGGPKKGFHAVALEAGRYLDRCDTTDTDDMVAWCANTMGATVIAVDAPCRWSVNGEGRPAERQLMRSGIWCFSTPTSGTAHTPHPTGYYDWMLRGEALYEALRPTHPLIEQWSAKRSRYCFETFPHAIAWHLRGGNADAKRKRKQRGELLEQAGIDITELTNIDLIDAALCALTAHRTATGQECVSYGEPNSGLIIVPSQPKP